MTTVTNILAFSSITAQSGQSTKKSDDASNFDALLKMVDSSDKKDKKAAGAASPTDLMGSIQQFMANVNASLFDLGSTDSASATSASASVGLSSSGSISVDELLNQGGPLPAYLDKVAERYGLDDAHKQALRAITIQFKDTAGSAAEVAALADALKSAGIG